MKLAPYIVLFTLSISFFANAQTPAPTTRPANRSDANGNPIRSARTGHVSNYDEAKVGSYKLPDPLVLNNGQPVRDAKTWFEQRRPEILEMYRSQIYGRVPENAPKVTWEVASTEPAPINGATLKRLVGRIGDQPEGPKFAVALYLPANAKGPVPVILCINFFGAPARGRVQPFGAATQPSRLVRAPIGGDPIADILAHGYGYATVTYSEIQPDNANTYSSGVIKMTLAPGQEKPAPDQWGTISAWAWGLSRVVDYFETDKAVDAKRVAIMGHSRLGKTVLWAGAQDPRIAMVYSSCSGEMGAAISRRDYGETVDDMAQNFPWQFCGNFQKYAGHWNDMPVDAHMLIALNAPHPVYITGGTGDQWADPKGEFLAEVAAGPVYKLLGKKDLGTTALPPLDTPLISGDLGYRYHTGGHAATKEDWNAFLEFAGKYLKSRS